MGILIIYICKKCSRNCGVLLSFCLQKNEINCLVSVTNTDHCVCKNIPKEVSDHKVGSCADFGRKSGQRKYNIHKRVIVMFVPLHMIVKRTDDWSLKRGISSARRWIAGERCTSGEMYSWMEEPQEQLPYYACQKEHLTSTNFSSSLETIAMATSQVSEALWKVTEMWSADNVKFEMYLCPCGSYGVRVRGVSNLQAFCENRVIRGKEEWLHLSLFVTGSTQKERSTERELCP